MLRINSGQQLCSEDAFHHPFANISVAKKPAFGGEFLIRDTRRRRYKNSLLPFVRGTLLRKKKYQNRPRPVFWSVFDLEFFCHWVIVGSSTWQEIYLSESALSLVVFYDCCTPWGIIADVMKTGAPFTEHIFVRDQFRAGACNNDAILLRQVEEFCKTRGARCRGVLVTSDERFIKKVEKGRAEHNIEGVVRLLPFNLRRIKMPEIILIQAHELVAQLRKIYEEMAAP